MKLVNFKFSTLSGDLEAVSIKSGKVENLVKQSQTVEGIFHIWLSPHFGWFLLRLHSTITFSISFAHLLYFINWCFYHLRTLRDVKVFNDYQCWVISNRNTSNCFNIFLEESDIWIKFLNNCFIEISNYSLVSISHFYDHSQRFSKIFNSYVELQKLKIIKRTFVFI